MRVGLVVSSLIASSALLASFTQAQPAPSAPAAQPAQTPAPPAASPAAAPPAAAGAAPPPAAAAPVATTAAEGFDLKEALRGPGAPMTPDEAAKRAVKTAPSIARAEAAANKAAYAAEQANVALYPRLDLEARYTRLSSIPPSPLVGLINFAMTTPGTNPPSPAG